MAERDLIDSLIGPIEEIIAKCDGLPGYVKTYVLGGLEQAKETLEETVAAIDDHDEPDEDDLDLGTDTLYEDDEEDEEDEED
jgi:hypothetical protein